MSNKKTLEQMSTTEAKRAGITSLADRPNDASRYGDGGLSTTMLKERFDALPNLVREKFNKIAEVLAGPDAAKYIGLDGSVGGVDNLYDLLLLFGARGTGQSDKNISDYIETLYDVPLEDANGNKNYSRTLRDIVQSIVSRFALVEASKGARLELTEAEDGKITVKLLNASGEVLEEATAGGPAKTAGIADGAVTNGKLAGEAVTTEKIKDGVVTGEKLASKSVSLEKLGDDVSGKIKHLEDSAFEKVSYDALTGVLTFTAKNGKTGSIDLPLELLVKEGRYDEDTKDIVLVLANGGEIRIPFDAYVDKVSEFITELRGSYKDARLEEEHLVFEAHDGSSKEIDLSSFASRDEVNTALGSLTARDAELEKTDANLERRVSNIEQHISDDYFVTDNTVSYKKTVPARACSTAKLLSIGGMTYLDEETQTLRDSKVTEIVSEGVNRFDSKKITSQSSSTIKATAIDENTFTLTSKADLTQVKYLPVTVYIPIENGVSNAYIKFNAKPIGTGAITKGFMNMNILDASRNILASNLSLSGVGELSKTFDIARYLKGDKGYLAFALFASAGEKCEAGDGVKYTNVMISFDVDVPYTPYKSISYPIPAEIQAIEGFGKDGFVIDIEKQRSQFGDYDNPLPVPFEPFIEVEGGGSIEFVNEYEQAVPSAVKYLLKKESTV